MSRNIFVKWIMGLSMIIIIVSSCKDDTTIQFPPCQVITPIDGQKITIGDTVTITVDAPNSDIPIDGALVFIDEKSKCLNFSIPINCYWETAGESLGLHVIKAGVMAYSGATTFVEVAVEIIIDGNGGGENLEFIYVEGGIFLMGSDNGDDNEQPIHQVTISSFEISKFEITNSQYCEFLNDISCISNGKYNGIEYIDMEGPRCQISYIGGVFITDQDKEDFPVVEVSWYGANTYSNWAGGRLSTEAEWEFAARGGIKSNNYLYSGSNELSEVGWSTVGVNSESHLVGTKMPNELGIFDMSGNVREMCYDGYFGMYYSYSPDIDPVANSGTGSPVVRGGSWHDGAYNCRVTNRMWTNTGGGAGMVGFRVAR